jgi:hypothetical protein
MKADLSTNDIIRIQVVSRLSDLLFDELQKINLDDAPLSARRIHLTAIENAALSSHDRLVAGNPRRGYRFASRQGRVASIGDATRRTQVSVRVHPSLAEIDAATQRSRDALSLDDAPGASSRYGHRALNFGAGNNGNDWKQSSHFVSMCSISLPRSDPQVSFLARRASRCINPIG